MQDAWPLIKDHWLTGIGRGAYISVYPYYKKSALQLLFAYPENIVLELLSGFGLVFGSALLGAFVVVLSGWRGDAAQS